MQSLAWKEVRRVVVLVRWKNFTGKFSSIVWKSSNVERETRQVVQTGKHAWQTVFDDTFSKSSDVQEGEFVLFEVNKFKFLGCSFTTNSHGGFVRWSLWKTRQNKLTQFGKTLERKELAWSNNIFGKWQKIYILLLPVCASESKIKRRSRLKLTRNSDIFMLRVVFKTAPSFGRSLANSSKTSDEVKLQTFLQVKSMLNINDVHLVKCWIDYHKQKDHKKLGPFMTLELYSLYIYVLMCCCFQQEKSIENRVEVQSI